MSTSPNGGDGGSATMGVSAVVIVLAAIAVALRFYSRILTRTGLGWDDWLIFAAVFLTLVTAALLLWGNAIDANGTWVSDNNDPAYNYTSEDILYLKLSFATSILYFSIAGTTKLAILVMYNRIFSASKSFRYQVLAASACVIGWWIGTTVTSFVNCIPLEYSWINSLTDPRYCINYNIFWMAAGACEIFLDTVILALPIHAVVKLHLSLRNRISIGGILLLGGFVIVTGLLKVILGYVPGGRVPSYSNTEVWTTVHTGISIVCACLPVLKPLIPRIANSTLVAKWSSNSLRPASSIPDSKNIKNCRSRTPTPWLRVPTDDLPDLENTVPTEPPKTYTPLNNSLAKSLPSLPSHLADGNNVGSCLLEKEPTGEQAGTDEIKSATGGSIREQLTNSLATAYSFYLGASRHNSYGGSSRSSIFQARPSSFYSPV